MFYNDEPAGDGVTVKTTWDWVYAFNWYAENAGEREASKYLGCNVVVAKEFETLAWTRRLVERGFVLGEKEQATHDEMVTRFNKRLAAIQQQVVVKEEKPEVNIQERIRTRALEYLDLLEDEVHQIASSDLFPKIKAGKYKQNFYQWFTDLGVKPQHVNHIVLGIKVLMNQLQDTRDLDEDSKNSSLRQLELFLMAKEDLKRILENKNVDRKPRKKKVVTADKLIKDLKFLKESTEFKVKSIDPSRIVGATQLWTFNVKYRQLGVLIATEGKTFTVRGSTIYDVDEEKSYTKTLRKPLEVLEKIVNGARKTNLALMEKINAKPAPFPGRINKDVVLLKVENK